MYYDNNTVGQGVAGYPGYPNYDAEYNRRLVLFNNIKGFFGTDIGDTIKACRKLEAYLLGS